jgi:hypothetical protein
MGLVDDYAVLEAHALVRGVLDASAASFALVLDNHGEVVAVDGGPTHTALDRAKLAAELAARLNRPTIRTDVDGLFAVAKLRSGWSLVGFFPPNVSEELAVAAVRAAASAIKEEA